MDACANDMSAIGVVLFMKMQLIYEYAYTCAVFVAFFYSGVFFEIPYCSKWKSIRLIFASSAPEKLN